MCADPSSFSLLTVGVTGLNHHIWLLYVFPRLLWFEEAAFGGRARTIPCLSHSFRGVTELSCSSHSVQRIFYGALHRGVPSGDCETALLLLSREARCCLDFPTSMFRPRPHWPTLAWSDVMDLYTSKAHCVGTGLFFRAGVWWRLGRRQTQVPWGSAQV